MDTREAPVVSELERRLDSLRQTIRRTAVIAGAAATVRLACLCMAAAFLLDMLWESPRLVRVGLLTATLSAVVAFLFFRVVRPMLRRIGHAELAALVETAHPEMEERLLSSLELAQSSDAERIKGSPLMRDMLIRETAKAARDVEFEDAVDSSRAVRQTIQACVVFLAVLAPFVFLQDGYSTVWARFFNPWGNHAYGTRLHFDVRPGDAVVPRGEDVAITGVPHFRFGALKSLTAPRVTWVDDDGEREYRDLKPSADGASYSAIIPQVDRGLRYRVESSEGASQEFRIEVVDRPTLTGLTMNVQPPAYSGRAAQRMDGLVGETTVFEHSTLTFSATFNKPISEVRWLWLDDVRHKYEKTPLEAPESERPGGREKRCPEDRGRLRGTVRHVAVHRGSRGSV
jgi:hypothetical protein